MTMQTQTTMERIASRVTVIETGCHVWQGALNHGGYGIVKVDGRTLRAHRVVYALSAGVDLPASVDVDHACRNRACVNPDHLRAQSQAENRSDGARYRWRIWRHLQQLDAVVEHLRQEE